MGSVTSEPPSPAEVECCERGDAALTRAFSVLGKRWTAVVLGCLRPGPAGFRELSRAIGGVSDSVLSDRLSELAEEGLVTRTVCEGPPVTVSYELTERGQALMPALDQVARWARENLLTETV
jgi:DNA-binding HxlR family transcriptional regulator